MHEKREEEESEDGQGNPIYIKERCANYQQMKKEIKIKQERFNKMQDRLIEQNKKLVENGKKPLNV